MVADPNAPDRHLACLVMSGLAVGDESTWLTDPPNVDQLQREVARKARMTVGELEKVLAEWVAAAPNDASRRDREISAEDIDGPDA